VANEYEIEARVKVTLDEISADNAAREISKRVNKEIKLELSHLKELAKQENFIGGVAPDVASARRRRIIAEMKSDISGGGMFEFQQRDFERFRRQLNAIIKYSSMGAGWNEARNLANEDIAEALRKRRDRSRGVDTGRFHGPMPLETGDTGVVHGPQNDDPTARRRAWMKNRAEEWMMLGDDKNTARLKALDEFHEKIKRANQNFQQLGVSMNSWEKMWHAIGQGGIRRGVAIGVSGGLESMGMGSAAAAGIGGFTGALASSLILPLAWAMGNALMALPGKVLTERERLAKFTGGGTPEQKNSLEQIWSTKSLLHATIDATGKEKWINTAMQLQEVGKSPAEIAKWSDALMRIGMQESGTSPEQLAAHFARAEEVHDPKDVVALLQSRAIRTAAISQHKKFFGRMSPESQEKWLMQMAEQRTFGYKDIELAIEEAQNNATLAGREEASRRSGAGWLRAAQEGMIQMASGEGNPANARAAMDNAESALRRKREPSFFDSPYQAYKKARDKSAPTQQDYRTQLWTHGLAENDENIAELQRRMGYAPPGSPTGAPGSTKQQDFHPNYIGSQYQFAGFSQFAEQMQMLWSGPGQDYQSQTASSTKEMAAMFKDGSARVQVASVGSGMPGVWGIDFNKGGGEGLA
jgi:hypothetical protein